MQQSLLNMAALSFSTGSSTSAAEILANRSITLLQEGSMALTIPERELFINGKWVPPVRGKYLDTVNPATEAVVGRIPAGTQEDVEAALAAAAAAHKRGTWARSTGKERAVVLKALAQKVCRRLCNSCSQQINSALHCASISEVFKVSSCGMCPSTAV